MNKLGLVMGIALLLLGGYYIAIRSLSFNENNVGSIEIRKDGWKRFELMQEETESLVSKMNELKFKLGSNDLDLTTDEAGYKGPETEFRLFLFDKVGKELATIRIYDEKNISYVKDFNGTFSLHYHATNGSFNLEELNSFLNKNH